MKIKFPAYILILIILLFSSGGVSRALSQKKNRDYESTVTLRLVQVYVTDKKGNPVMGLEKDDFQLYDGGKRQTITDFERYFALPEQEGNIAEKKDKESRGIRAPRRCFLFFDFAFNNALGIRRAVQASLHFLKNQVQPDDLVGLISYGADRGIVIHEYLTGDHKQVLRAVKRIGVSGILGRAENVEARYFRIVLDDKRTPVGADESYDMKTAEYESDAQNAGRPLFNFIKREVMAERRLYQQHVRNYTQRLKEMALALQDEHRRIHFLYFSSGAAASALGGLGDSKWIGVDFERSLKDLADANCVFFTINTENQDNYLYMPLDARGDSTLKKIADFSGGRFFPNVENYERISDEIQSMTGSYYVLGYYVQEKMDGRFHKIKVKVSRKGCRIDTQKGYFNPKSFSEYSRLEKKIHLIKLALYPESWKPGTLSHELTAVPFDEGRGQAVKLTSLISSGIIRKFNPKQTEIVDLIFDAQGDLVGLNRKLLEAALFEQQGATHDLVFSLKPGTYHGRSVIRDLETGRASVAACRFLVPEAKQ